MMKKKSLSSATSTSTKWDTEFERQVQELAGVIMFPAMATVAVLTHLTLVYFSSMGLSNGHLQAWLLCMYAGFWLWSREGWLMRPIHGRLNVRASITVGCLLVYAVVWLMAFRDASMRTESPGPRALGVLLGALMGTWLGCVATSAADFVEATTSPSATPNSGEARKPANRAERRRLLKQQPK